MMFANIFKKKNKSFYTRVYKTFGPLVRFFSRIKVHGKENIPIDGGYILCANHIAVRDVLLIVSTCPRKINFVAKKELFSVPLLRGLIKAMGAIKLDRSGNDVNAMRKSVEIAKSGEIVAIFPQGHRYPGVDPSTTPIKNGAGMIAYRSRCDVIPVFIKTPDNKYGIFKRPEIFYGKPIKNSDLGFKHGGNDEYKAATDIIYDAMLNLGGYSRSVSKENSLED